MSQYYDLLSTHNKLKTHVVNLEKSIKNSDATHGFIGMSDSASKIRSVIETVADTPLSILIEGNTGTGKEVAAMTIHSLSNRKEKPFVKLDCTTIPVNLIESEVFGHEKGAFTGAFMRHTGRIEQAHGGTLFIDEIANLPLSVQAKFLDFLQTHEITRIGGNQRKKIDVRIITASNQPLQTLVKEKLFREDLLYRINQITISIPPLMERSDDIPMLVKHFIDEANIQSHKLVEGVSPEGLKFLYSQKWEGNVRELKNIIYRAVYLTENRILQPDDLNLNFSHIVNIDHTKKRSRFSPEEIRAEIEKRQGNIRKTAIELGLSRATIYRKLISS